MKKHLSLRRYAWICTVAGAFGCGSSAVDVDPVVGTTREAITFNSVTRDDFTNGGVQANNHTEFGVINEDPTLNQDGRFVMFSSLASNLVSDDTIGRPASSRWRAARATAPSATA
jgi:hypothetical protein